ncbi:MAG: HAD family hydrolase [Planctomycetota bacterium]
MTIRTCFFDMGNVLIYFSHEKMVRNIAEVCGWPENQTKMFLLDEGRQWKLERGDITEEQFHEDFCRAAGRNLDIDELRLAAADIFWQNDSIVPVLHRLKENKIRLVLLSNTSITHMRFIEERFRVLDLMDDRVTSFAAQAMKPEDRIFEVALSKAQCPSDSCFYTDDIQPYVDKGASFGIHARLFTSTENLERQLSELNVL